MDKASPAFRKAIEIEYRKMSKDENLLHNTILHEHILETWRRDSPRMWLNLVEQKLTDKLAYCLQQRMWDHQEQLMDSGMPVTDAREMAERDHLMLEPEVSGDTMLDWSVTGALLESRQAMTDFRDSRES